MNATSETRGAIVIGVDGSASAERALHWAAEQATLEKRTLTVLHAPGSVTPSEAGWMARAGISRAEVLAGIAEAGRSVLEQVKEDLATRHDDLDIRFLLQKDTDARQALLDASEDAALLVIGSRGRGPIKSLLLGSVGVSVARAARCPAVVVRPHAQGEARHGVLVGTDGSETTQEALAFSYRIASQRDLPLTVMYAVGGILGGPGEFGMVPDDEPGLDSQRLLLAEAVSGLSEDYPDVRVHLRIARGLVEDSLVAASDQMDLVVMGRRRSSIADGIGLGSRTVSVLEHAGSVVVVVPEDLDRDEH